MPSIYLIESKEREGLIKIGYTGRDVRERIDDYKAAISDRSMVHRISGSKIFEKYFQTFFDSYHKDVPVSFKFLPNILHSTEWFKFVPHILAIFFDAFEKEPPQRLEDVNEDDLPIFLSGLISAIHWEAKVSSPEYIADMARHLDLIESFEAYERQILENRSDEQGENDALSDSYAKHESAEFSDDAVPIHQDINPSFSFPARELAQYATDSRGAAEDLRNEREKMEELQTSRTIVAVVAFICVV